jgi:type I restriction enzyme M protein
MSHIIAHELKNKNTLEIYDSASGSGSLLINIGQAVAQYAKSKDNIT